jgi:hypothetical protein
LHDIVALTTCNRFLKSTGFKFHLPSTTYALIRLSSSYQHVHHQCSYQIQRFSGHPGRVYSYGKAIHHLWLTPCSIFGFLDRFGRLHHSQRDICFNPFLQWVSLAPVIRRVGPWIQPLHRMHGSCGRCRTCSSCKVWTCDLAGYLYALHFLCLI